MNKTRDWRFLIEFISCAQHTCLFVFVQLTILQNGIICVRDILKIYIKQIQKIYKTVCSTISKWIENVANDCRNNATMWQSYRFENIIWLQRSIHSRMWLRPLQIQFAHKYLITKSSLFNQLNCWKEKIELKLLSMFLSLSRYLCISFLFSSCLSLKCICVSIGMRNLNHQQMVILIKSYHCIE